MTLASGTHLGRYEIRSKIGEGGMGEVYRAYDPKINREVAIKVLPAAFSADKDRLARFEQEAQAAGALNHPNILAIYDVDTHEGAPYVVSELLAGEALRDRLRHGPLPPRKAVDCALQIARGLAAAHEKGIIHRDIKPENLFITADGRVKILDFGLAKLIAPFNINEVQTDVPTRKLHTSPGAVLGTVGYMSPEQVQGLGADHRADIFSFGAVLYEMLSGRQAFHGDSAVETMSAILKQDPLDFSLAGVNIAAPLERVVLRCLEKKPAERFQSVSDVGFALEAVSEISSSGTAVPRSLPWLKNRERVGWLAAAVLLVLLLFILPFALGYFRSPPQEQISSVRFSISPPEKTEFVDNNDYSYSVAVSPDGRHLVLVTKAEGRTQLWLRSLDASAMQPLTGTDGGDTPFWSPDSRFIAFFADAKLKRLDVAGGPPQTICDAAGYSLGGTWNNDGVILFSRAQDGFFRVSAGGGEPVQVTKPDPARQEIQHFWPQFPTRCQGRAARRGR